MSGKFKMALVAALGAAAMACYGPQPIVRGPAFDYNGSGTMTNTYNHDYSYRMEGTVEVQEPMAIEGIKWHFVELRRSVVDGFLYDHHSSFVWDDLQNVKEALGLEDLVLEKGRHQVTITVPGAEWGDRVGADIYGRSLSDGDRVYLLIGKTRMK